MPTGRSGNTKKPAALVTDDRWSPLPWLVTVTVAPGMAACWASLTNPEIWPESNCANPAAGNPANTISRTQIRIVNSISGGHKIEAGLTLTRRRCQLPVSSFRREGMSTIERRGRKGRKERMHSFAAFAFQGGVILSNPLLRYFGV